MNFIYDILVNFNENLYDFYEWNLSDNVSHIRKIPLFKVSSETMLQFSHFDFKVETEFLKKIENRCEKFTTRDIERITYACLFSDGSEVLAVRFNPKGIAYQISKLLVDEQDEVIDVCSRFNDINISYELMNPKRQNLFKTRMQIEKNNYLLKSLDRLDKNNEIDKLKYLYFECFYEKQENKKTILKKLKEGIDNDKLGQTMYDFFKLISIN